MVCRTVKHFVVDGVVCYRYWVKSTILKPVTHVTLVVIDFLPVKHIYLLVHYVQSRMIVMLLQSVCSKAGYLASSVIIIFVYKF